MFLCSCFNQSSWIVSLNYGKRRLIDKRAPVSGQPASDGVTPAEPEEAPGFPISQGSRWLNTWVQEDTVPAFLLSEYGEEADKRKLLFMDLCFWTCSRYSGVTASQAWFVSCVHRGRLKSSSGGGKKKLPTSPDACQWNVDPKKIIFKSSLSVQPSHRSQAHKRAFSTTATGGVWEHMESMHRRPTPPPTTQGW